MKIKYSKTILNNGMIIILVPIKNVPSVSMGFFVKAGSRNETAENNGIAHFLEHMMFKGTKNRNASELFKQLDTLGFTYNAATNVQDTCYYINGNSIHAKKMLDIILDMYINPIFTTKEIEKEKKVVVEEMRMRSDAPFSKLFAKLNSDMFVNTSLERTVLGTEEIIMNFTREDVIKFRKSLYNPNNTVFVVTGNIEPISLMNIIERVLKPLNNSNMKPKTYYDEKSIIINSMNSQTQPYVNIRKNSSLQQVYVLLGFPMYDMYREYSREIDILAQLLTMGSSSRLSTALRENEGITYSSSAFPMVYTGCGIFIINFVINPKELIKGLKIIFKVLKKIKKEPMKKEEMKKIINAVSFEYISSLTKSIDYLIYFGLNFLTDSNFKPSIEQDIDSLKKIKRKDIQNIANKIFLRDKINLYMYGDIIDTDFDFINL
uniref:Peptidase M16 N-terminal domain-containing protein n=1 Tax=viral metagenome TaxID=1070528 RepID=A0A6C0LTW3_9ZZZZ